MQVAQGRTNREVAAALFLSAKTIEYHLGSIYRKLGIRGAGELAGSAGLLATSTALEGRVGYRADVDVRPDAAHPAASAFRNPRTAHDAEPRRQRERDPVGEPGVERLARDQVAAALDQRGERVDLGRPRGPSPTSSASGT